MGGLTRFEFVEPLLRVPGAMADDDPLDDPAEPVNDPAEYDRAEYDEPVNLAVCPWCGDSLEFNDRHQDGYFWWCENCESYLLDRLVAELGSKKELGCPKMGRGETRWATKISQPR